MKAGTLELEVKTENVDLLIEKLKLENRLFGSDSMSLWWESMNYEYL